MSAKPVLAFQPAPRPQPRTTPEQTRELTAATSDLGFARPTGSSPAEAAVAAPAPAEPSAPQAQPRPLAKPKASPAPRIQPSPASGAQTEVARKDPSLKFDVPDGLWNALRQEALNRRVTVKYLVLEALADKGYKVDLSAIPEDGRRLR